LRDFNKPARIRAKHAASRFALHQTKVKSALHVAVSQRTRSLPLEAAPAIAND
jgi:hypothetical protein